MYEANVDRVLTELKPTDLVLDIGGWARPFNRANFVLDAEPYETRGYYGQTRPPQAGGKEYFTKHTWIRRDICDKTPYPFANKEIDFVVCSHTLEDVRDPLWVCSEMVRIAKRGYLEVPSRLAESCRGIEPGQVGWSHHRWLVDLDGDSVSFLMKYHMIHSHWRFSFPAAYYRCLPESAQVQWLFWEDRFRFSETTIHGLANIANELESFVASRGIYPGWLVGTDRQYRRMAGFGSRVVGKLRREFFPPRLSEA